jgi:Na+/proline symporter
MENIILTSSLFMLALLGTLFVVGRTWNKSFLSFLFADRALTIGSTSLAISAHWFWAIAIFVGPAVAYNWGFIGLLWFVIPNALSLIVVGYLTSRIRDKYPDGFSLTRYVKENFSQRVSALYQLEFGLVAFAALLLAFTAISKLWGFVQLGSVIEPIYASLAVGVVTLLFTLRGGIRTSIFTGSIQTVLWLVLLGIATVAIITTGDASYFSLGKNDLSTIFDVKFLTTFAVAWFIAIIVGATGHGMMWQKSFSMPKENIMPAYTLAAVAFALVTFGISQLGMYAFANGLEVKAADTSQMVALTALLGTGALIAFATILIGQTSTVIDAALNYISSLVSMEWLKKESVGTSQAVMVVFIIYLFRLYEYFKCLDVI